MRLPKTIGEAVYERELNRLVDDFARRCKGGHQFDEANTIIYRGRRYCRACMALRTTDWAKRTKRWLGRAAYLKEWRRQRKQNAALL